MPRRSKYPGGGSIFVKNDRLVIQRIVSGERKRIYTGLPDIPKNRKICEQKLRAMHLEELLPTESTDKATYQEAFGAFLRERNVMPSTERHYKTSFDAIVTNKSWRVSEQGLIDFAVDFRHNPGNRSPTTINTYLRHFAAFARWCEDRYRFRRLNIQRQFVRAEPTVVKWFTDDELRTMSAHRDDPFIRVTLFMALTGARPVDVLTLEWSQVKEDVIVWKNKITKKAEPRPISTEARELLPSGGDTVFEWSYGSATTLSKRVKKHWQSAGVDIGGRSLKHLRTTFKRRIDKMPWPMQVWLMRHRPQGVTLEHYQSFDNGEALAYLDALPSIISPQ